MDREPFEPYDRWLDASEERFTMALVADVAEVLVRHGYPPPVGVTLVDLTVGLYRAVHHTRAAEPGLSGLPFLAPAFPLSAFPSLRPSLPLHPAFPCLASAPLQSIRTPLYR